MIKIAPSILSADFAHLADEVTKAADAGADMLHIDVMDGHFVPNLTFGPPVVAALRKLSPLPFDVHLMVTNPQDLVQAFAAAGADSLTVHVETAPHLYKLLQTIKELGLKTAVALNPSTSLTTLDEVLTELDMVLLMTVNPGFGGQYFIPAMLNKIRRLHTIIGEKGLAADIQVDGGISPANVGQVLAAGANVLVAGSAIYGAPDAALAVQALRQLQALPQPGFSR